MINLKMPSQLVCNRLVQEKNEDREFKLHLKKVEKLYGFIKFFFLFLKLIIILLLNQIVK
jgi:hypothetical protein